MFNEPDELDEPDYTPPPLQRGDKLFINNKARLQRDTSGGYGYHGYKMSTFHEYASAYKNAADILVQNNQGLPDMFLDELVLPIVFLYRHFVELILKDLLIEGNIKYGKPFTPEILNEHRIDLLWQKFKKLLQEENEDKINSEHVEALEACLLEFSKVDDRSMAFRYPVDKKNKPFLENNPHLQSVEYIDLHHLAEKIASIHQFYLNYFWYFTMEWE